MRLKPLVPLAMAIAIVLTLLPPSAGAADAAPATVYVTADLANVRSAPSLAAPTVLRVYQSDAIAVTGTVEGQPVNGNSTWYRTRSGYYVSATVVSTSSPASPATVPSGGRWIDVNLTTLRASAMVGSQAVYTTPIVSGRPGWETPTGTFHIVARTPLKDMDSTTIGMPKGTPGYYYQPNVPWIQYFTTRGHAIHGNDWVPASAFGSQRTSHGCIGMPIPASKYFYDFATVGTRVEIHY